MSNQSSPFTNNVCIVIAPSFVVGLLIGYCNIPLWLFLIPFLFSIFLFLWLSERTANPYKSVLDSRKDFFWIIPASITLGMIIMFLHKPGDYDFENDDYPPYAFGTVKKIDFLSYGDKATVEIHGFTNMADRITNINPLLVNIVTNAACFGVGDEILFPNELRPVEYNLNYADKFIGNRNVRYSQKIKSRFISITKKGHEHNSVYTTVRNIIWESDLSQGSKGLLSTLLLGESDSMSATEKKAFSSAGISHILAVSGLHLGIIALILSWLLLPLNFFLNHRIRYIILIAFLWGYTCFCGFPPSCVRACIMISVYYFSIIIERRYSALNAVCAAVILMLAVSPMSIFDIGLQLSVTTVVGILLLMPALDFGLQHSHPVIYRICNMGFVTIVAVISSWIITAYYFGIFPLMFLPVNLLILPTLPVMICVSALCIGFLFAGIDASFLIWIIDSWHDGILMLTSLCSDSVELKISGVTVLLYCFIFITGIIAIYIRKKKIALRVLCLLLIGIVIDIFIPFSKEPSGFIVQNYPDAVYIRTYQQGKDSLIKFDKDAFTEVAIAENDIVVADGDIDFYDSMQSKTCDYLIIGNGYNGQLTDLLRFFNPRRIILHSSLKGDKESTFKYECKSSGYETHIIREDGPLRVLD